MTRRGVLLDMVAWLLIEDHKCEALAADGLSGPDDRGRRVFNAAAKMNRRQLKQMNDGKGV